MPARPTALTIAGSDSGGGAGIQADLKTFTVLGVYGASILTALTAQNTVGVQAVHALPSEFVAQQFDSVCSDIRIGAAMTGMLADAELRISRLRTAYGEQMRLPAEDELAQPEDGLC